MVKGEQKFKYGDTIYDCCVEISRIVKEQTGIVIELNETLFSAFPKLANALLAMEEKITGKTLALLKEHGKQVFKVKKRKDKKHGKQSSKGRKRRKGLGRMA